MIVKPSKKNNIDGDDLIYKETDYEKKQYYKFRLSDPTFKKIFNEYLLKKYYSRRTVKTLTQKILIQEFSKFNVNLGLELTKPILISEFNLNPNIINPLGPDMFWGYIMGYTDARGISLNRLLDYQLGLKKIPKTKISNSYEQDLFNFVWKEEKFLKEKFVKPDLQNLFHKLNEKYKLIDNNLIQHQKFTTSPLYNRYKAFRIKRKKEN